MVVQFLMSLVEIFKGYFGSKINEDTIRNNFTLVYELLDGAWKAGNEDRCPPTLLDSLTLTSEWLVPPLLLLLLRCVLTEVLDFGHPQTTAIDVLKLYINLGDVKVPETAADQAKMTSAITGARDWRRDGIVHKKNEVFIDVMESVNLLVSTNGGILRSDVSGVIQMKANLTGMPECKFALNDKLSLEKDGRGGAGGRAKAKSGVEIDDATFHRCVQLGKFDADRSITFVPPDGEFELMRYRISENIQAPFRVIPVVEEQGQQRVVMNVKVIANFSAQLYATNVIVKIPVRSCFFLLALLVLRVFFLLCPPISSIAPAEVKEERKKVEGEERSR